MRSSSVIRKEMIELETSLTNFKSNVNSFLSQIEGVASIASSVGGDLARSNDTIILKYTSPIGSKVSKGIKECSSKVSAEASATESTVKSKISDLKTELSQAMSAEAAAAAAAASAETTTTSTE